MGKTRQIAENKQTFDLSGKIEIEGKNRQNAENKETFSLWKLMIFKYLTSSMFIYRFF